MCFGRPRWVSPLKPESAQVWLENFNVFNTHTLLMFSTWLHQSGFSADLCQMSSVTVLLWRNVGNVGVFFLQLHINRTQSHIPESKRGDLCLAAQPEHLWAVGNVKTCAPFSTLFFFVVTGKTQVAICSAYTNIYYLWTHSMWYELQFIHSEMIGMDCW